MRPHYETSLDRKRESDFAAYLTGKTGLVFKKIPDSYMVDYLVSNTDGIPCFWLEMKFRNIDPYDYPTIMISANKVKQGISLALTFGIPFVFLVGFNGGNWGWVDVGALLLQKKGYIEFGGRTVQTRDDQDAEPVLHIPIGEFSIFNKTLEVGNFGFPFGGVPSMSWFDKKSHPTIGQSEFPF